MIDPPPEPPAVWLPPPPEVPLALIIPVLVFTKVFEDIINNPNEGINYIIIALGSRVEDHSKDYYIIKEKQKGNNAKTIHSAIYDAIEVPRLDENGNFVTQTSEFNENEELLKVVRKTSVPNGFREEILFEK